MTKTKIEWADEVWNPVTGCSKVSAGCKNCYAERLANRFWGERKFTDVKCHPERLDDPRRWRKPRRVFVNSMSDLFHPDVPDEFISDVFCTMRDASRQTFIVLTKRPERMSKLLAGTRLLPSNIWLGVSAEDQESFDQRVPWLLDCDAVVRMVSVEPMLGPVLPWTPALSLNWVICGGESGPGARPMHPDWVRSLRDQCRAGGIPFFFKQWGEWYPVQQGKVPELRRGQEVHFWDFPYVSIRFGKARAGRLLDGQEWNEFPEASHA